MMPSFDKNGLPRHDDECPAYDGKRCSEIGFQPDAFCEPALKAMAAELRRTRARGISGYVSAAEVLDDGSKIYKATFKCAACIALRAPVSVVLEEEK
jgi:hypothetical protein